jgi:N-carbamoyl-L-amino-acid hydrolase
MLEDAKQSSLKFAQEGNVRAAWDRIWRIEPVPFDPRLIDLCTEAIDETCGKTHRLPSGPLHDAAEVARAGVPTVMMFVQSLHGISHNKIEDTKEEHLELCVTAFDRLAEKTMHLIA